MSMMMMMMTDFGLVNLRQLPWRRNSGRQVHVPLVTPSSLVSRREPGAPRDGGMTRWNGRWLGLSRRIRLQRPRMAGKGAGQKAAGTWRRWAEPGRRGSRQELGGLVARSSVSTAQAASASRAVFASFAVVASRRGNKYDSVRVSV